MSNFWNKLNTLVRAHVDRFLEEDVGLLQDRRTRGPIAAARLGQNVDGEIAALRAQIDEALEREERLEAEIAALSNQIADLDVQADNALLDGQEAAARNIVAEMQRAEKKRAFLEADLAEHRHSTGEFIQRVNLLETIVADSRHRAEEEHRAGEVGRAEETGVESESRPEPQSQSTPQSAPGATLDSVLHTARQEIEALKAEDATLQAAQAAAQGGETAVSKAEDSTQKAQDAVDKQRQKVVRVPVTINAVPPDATREQVKKVVQDAQVEDDLAARRARLAGKPSQDRDKPKPAKPDSES